MVVAEWLFVLALSLFVLFFAELCLCVQLSYWLFVIFVVHVCRDISVCLFLHNDYVGLCLHNLET